MVSLLDVAPPARFVDVLGSQLQVRGVTIGAIAALVGKYPVVKDLLNGKADSVDFSVEGLTTMAPGLVADLIAAGLGHAMDPEYVDAADRLPIGAQVDLLAAIVEVTLPRGIGPFVETLTAAFAQVSGAGMKAPVTK